MTIAARAKARTKLAFRGNVSKAHGIDARGGPCEFRDAWAVRAIFGTAEHAFRGNGFKAHGLHACEAPDAEGELDNYDITQLTYLTDSCELAIL